MRSRFIVFPAAAIIALATGRAARADFSQDYIFNNVAYEQTSAAAPTTPSGRFFSIEATTVNPNDFSSVTVTYPGPLTPLSLTQVATDHFFYGASGTSPANIASQLPFGTYTFTSNIPTVASLNYTANAFTTDIPALSSTTYTALQGANPAQAIPLAFNSFTPNALSTVAYTFLTITDASTSAAVYSEGFLGPNTTSAPDIAPNTLLPDQTYDYELDFSDRINGYDGTYFNSQGFDVRTDGSFTTGSVPVPEPTSMLLLASAVAGAGLIRRRF